MLTQTQQLFASSLRDSIPIKALKNALIVADSLNRCMVENAALKRLDSISNIIIDTLIKGIKLKEKQLQISQSINKDYANLVVVLSTKNEQNLKAAKRELFWKRFFQFTTVAAVTAFIVK